MSRRDNVIIKKIVLYCDRISEIIARFDLNFNKFETDFAMQMSISMGILQFGELVNSLTDDFRNSHKEMPWRQIINMRNKAAHAYDEFDFELVWETATADIPQLREKCKMMLAE